MSDPKSILAVYGPVWTDIAVNSEFWNTPCGYVTRKDRGGRDEARTPR
jgi:hypothetical protein